MRELERIIDEYLARRFTSDDEKLRVLDDAIDAVEKFLKHEAQTPVEKLLGNLAHKYFIELTFSITMGGRI